MKYGDAVKTWEAVLDGKKHVFRYEHNFWSGKKSYFVDDEMIQHVSGSLMESTSIASDVTFTIGAHEGRFRHRAVGRLVFYDLFIDDEKIKGEEKRALRLPLWAFFLLIGLLFLVAWLSMNSGAGNKKNTTEFTEYTEIKK